jgi:hypothetical protein
MDAIPNSGENFMIFSMVNLKFIDSIQLMAFSFEKLTQCVKSKTGDPLVKFINMKFVLRSRDVINIIFRVLPLRVHRRPHSAKL